MKFAHGMRVKATKNGIQTCEDARISVNADGKMFICQDVWNGTSAQNKLGYKCSWCIGMDWQPGQENLTSITALGGFYPQVGDYLVMDGLERKVLAVLEDLVFLSTGIKNSNGETTANGYFHRLELERLAYKIKGREEAKKEVVLTMDEVAEKFGVDVKTLKIKKD